jgi:hypothetical protein
MTDHLKLLYDIKDFSTLERAREHFRLNWEGDNASMRREVVASGGKSLEELFPNGGAQFLNGRWHVFKELETLNFTKLQPGTRIPGADGLLSICPRCGKTAYPKSIPSWPPVISYIHLTSIQDGKHVDVAFCEVLKQQGGIIDASSF